MIVWELLVVVLLILLNGFFSMSELAIVSARRGRLQAMAEEGRRGARVALTLAEDPSRFLSTVQIGISLVGVLAGAYGGATLSGYLASSLRDLPAVGPYADQIAFGAVVVAITYFSLIIGELVPKRFALANAEGIAATVAGPMAALARVARPLVWFLGWSTDLVLRLIGFRTPQGSTVTEEEVKSMIAEGTETGVFAPAERQLLEGVLRLADRPVRAIMTPRPDVAWLDAGDDAEAIRREITQYGHSRMPVCRGDLDEVVGIVHTKTLLDAVLAGRPVDLTKNMEQPLIVHDGTPVLRLLELFRQSGTHLTVVVDEYGSVEGVATVTDILESIAGELPEIGHQEDADFIQREDGSWLIDGMAPIDDVEHRLSLKGLRTEDDDFHTLAGFVLRRLGRIPKATDAFSWQDIRFEVIDMDGRRVDKVLVTLPKTDIEADQG